MIIAHTLGNSLWSTSSDAFNLYEKQRFGEKKEGKIEYTLLEAGYLIKAKRMKVMLKNKEMSSNEALKKIRKGSEFETKEAVFSDLRKKGYIVKTALKFGTDFRVYDKGKKPGNDHAYWLVSVVKDTAKVSWYDFAAKNRIANNTKKKLVIAVVDQEKSITYYEVSWVKP